MSEEQLSAAVSASFALLSHVCSQAAVASRANLRGFEVHLTDRGDIWSFDPRRDGSHFVLGARGDSNLRLNMDSESWLHFVLARAETVDVTNMRIDGDISCLEPFVEALKTPQNWLELRVRQQ